MGPSNAVSCSASWPADGCSPRHRIANRGAAAAGQAEDAATQRRPGGDARDRRLSAAGLAARDRTDPGRRRRVGHRDSARARDTSRSPAARSSVPCIYRTSELFLRLFGLGGPDELPRLEAFEPSPSSPKASASGCSGRRGPGRVDAGERRRPAEPHGYPCGTSQVPCRPMERSLVTAHPDLEPLLLRAPQRAQAARCDGPRRGREGLRGGDGRRRGQARARLPRAPSMSCSSPRRRASRPHTGWGRTCSRRGSPTRCVTLATGARSSGSACGRTCGRSTRSPCSRGSTCSNGPP